MVLGIKVASFSLKFVGRSFHCLRCLSFPKSITKRSHFNKTGHVKLLHQKGEANDLLAMLY
jgi:hypothetical protein